MFYLGSLFATLVMVVIVTAVGLRLCDWLPYRIRSVGRGYFSPIIGLSVFILLATAIGWMSPLSFPLCASVTGALAAYALWRERTWPRLLPLLAAFLAFSVLASTPILFPTLRYAAFNPMTDAFTYIEHAQWLQLHAFSEPALASGYYPAATQVVAYQKRGHRMGASFFLGWFQALFHTEWSYYAFPAAVAVPLIAGSLAVGGSVRLITRRGRTVPALTAAVTATTLNGFVYGSTYGFFPQTFGLAFVAGAISLLGASLALKWRTRALARGRLEKPSLARQVKESFPVALAFAAFTYTYNDLLVLVMIAIAAFVLGVALVRRRELASVLAFLAMVAIETLVLLNVEMVRVMNNFLNTSLDVGSGTVRYGWPVRWAPWEFVALVFGMRHPEEGIWLFITRQATAVVLTILMAAVLIALAFRLWRLRFSLVLLLYLATLGVFGAAFVYFRYFLPGLEPGEIGGTFNQFKLAKWASVSAFVVVGVAADYYWRLGRIAAGMVSAALIGVTVVGIIGHAYASDSLTNAFPVQTGYPRDAFLQLVHLRRLVQTLPADEIIYLNLGDANHKLRQMVTYVLWDRKLASNYNDDGYISRYLSVADRTMPYAPAKWLIEFAPPATAADSVADARAGNLVVRRRPDAIVSMATVTGGFDRETDGNKWWHWTADSLIFNFNVRGASKGKVHFLYMPASSDSTLTVRVKGVGESSFSLPMRGGWNQYSGPVIDVAEPHASLTFTSDKPATPAGADGRPLAFLIGDMRIETLDASIPVLQSVVGGTGREDDGATGWRYWTAKQLDFHYKVPERVKAARLKFTYMPAVLGRTLQVVVSGRSKSVLRIPMKPSWNNYLSEPIPMDGPDITVSFLCDGEAVRLGPNDPRIVTYVIQNLELVPVEAPPPAASKGG